MYVALDTEVAQTEPKVQPPKRRSRISARSRHRESDVADGLRQTGSYCRASTTSHANALVRNTKVDVGWRRGCSAANIGGSNNERTPFRNVIALSIVSGCPSILLNATPDASFPRLIKLIK